MNSDGVTYSLFLLGGKDSDNWAINPKFLQQTKHVTILLQTPWIPEFLKVTLCSE